LCGGELGDAKLEKGGRMDKRKELGIGDWEL
jgi:hypothetical protein